MSSTCTLTIHPAHSAMASVATLSPSNSFTRRYGRALSSPVQPSPTSSVFSQSPKSSKIISTQSQSEKSLADSVSKLAALPSLSKSLNHLPSLAGQPAKEIPVYEGMPSRAQKSSHEKLRMALGNSSKDGSHPREKNGFYSNPFFSMTPMHASPASAPAVPGVRTSRTSSSMHVKQKTFSFYADEDDEEESSEDN